VWLAPQQVAVLPISDKHLDYAREVYNQLFEKGVRAQMDDASESLGKKIRAAELMKVPYILVVGDKEVETGSVAVRSHKTKDQTVMSLEDFEVKIFKEIQERSL
jgi:threonyl-tRNA synthetase